jgi:hypothetical protein
VNNLCMALVFIGFYSAISIAIYVTQSAWPLLALGLTPKIQIQRTTTNEDDEPVLRQ